MEETAETGRAGHGWDCLRTAGSPRSWSVSVDRESPTAVIVPLCPAIEGEIRGGSAPGPPLTGARAVAEIAASLPFVMQESDTIDRAVEVVSRALLDIPAYRLYFRRDASFWDVVEEKRG